MSADGMTNVSSDCTATDVLLATEKKDAARFICNICLETVGDSPVVTLCGHLYCWPCLYTWLRTDHGTCPVCHAGVTAENIVPLFIRSSTDEADATNASDDTQSSSGMLEAGRAERRRPSATMHIPPRPAAHRPDVVPPSPYTTYHTFLQQPLPTNLPTTIRGFFPSLVTLLYTPPSANNTGLPATEEERAQLRASTNLIILGFVVLFFWVLL